MSLYPCKEQCIKTKRGSPKATPFTEIRSVRSDDVHVHAGHGAVEVSANHLLAVAGHNTLARSEILWREDCWCDNQRNIRSVDVAGLEVAAALVTDEDLVTGEVGILVDGEAVA